MAYTIDAYRSGGGEKRRFSDVLLYISFFPQLIAGPIVKYSDVAQQIASRTESWADFSAGCSRFLIGLGKKCCCPIRWRW